MGWPHALATRARLGRRVEVYKRLKQQLQLQLRDHGPGWLLCLAPLAAGGFLVALVAPTLAPPKSQLDPQLLQAMLQDPPAAPKPSLRPSYPGRTQGHQSQRGQDRPWKFA